MPFKIAHESSWSENNMDLDLNENSITNFAKEMWETHSNLTIITADKLKIVNGVPTPKQCIVLYCLSKGFIPLGEKSFPDHINSVSMGKVAVDVREGFFTFGPGPVGDMDRWNDTLCMGCNIGEENRNGFGSLGIFIRKELNGRLGFLTCCHVLFDCIREEQFKYDRSVDGNVQAVLQPHKNAFCGRDNRKCGEIEKAVFDPNGSISVDAALVSITDRAPTTGYFVIRDQNQISSIGMPPDTYPLYNSGEILRSISSADRYKPVIKSGTSTGLTMSHFRLDGIQVRLPKGVIMGSRDNKPFPIKGQYEINANSGYAPFFIPGDSGAGVFMMETDNLKCIGLAIGSTSYGTTVVTPIGAILDSLGLRDSDVATFP